jgi:hypothetical protein
MADHEGEGIEEGSTVATSMMSWWWWLSQIVLKPALLVTQAAFLTITSSIPAFRVVLRLLKAFSARNWYSPLAIHFSISLFDGSVKYIQSN